MYLIQTQYVQGAMNRKPEDISLKETLALLPPIAAAAVSRKLGYGKQPEKSLSGDLPHAGVASKNLQASG